MYKRYYDGYGSFERQRANCAGELVIPRECDEEKENRCTEEICPPPCEERTVQQCCPPVSKGGLSSIGGLDRLFNNIAIDDIILLGVILLVLKDSVDDPLLIIILTVIFISGFIEG